MHLTLEECTYSENVADILREKRQDKNKWKFKFALNRKMNTSIKYYHS